MGHGAVALAVLVFPQVAGAFLEARLLLWAERGDLRRWIAGGQIVLALCLAAAAAAPSAWWLGLALVVAAPAGGLAMSLAEGCVAEGSAEGRERAMSRWMLVGALGDLAAPALVAMLAAFSLGWRSALVSVGVLIALHGLAVLRGPRLLQPLDEERSESGGGDRDGDGFGDETPTQGAPLSMRVVRFVDVLRRPQLMVWLLGVTVCSLLDETFVALSGAWLAESLGASSSVRAVAVGCWAMGSAAGAFATERVLRRHSPRRVLAAGAALCAVASLIWLAAPSTAWAAVGLFAVGFSSAPLWPIAMARAYEACPGRPALVGAAESLFVPLELALIAGAGQLADVAGVEVALVVLVAQPLLLLALAGWGMGFTNQPRRSPGSRV